MQAIRTPQEKSLKKTKTIRAFLLQTKSPQAGIEIPILQEKLEATLTRQMWF